MEPIKLLALDMDGTAYFYMGDIVPANRQPIQKAIAQGIEVVFFTGRPPLAQPNQLKENGFISRSPFLISHNGATIYDLEKNLIVKSETIPKALALKVFQLAELPEFKGTVLWGYVNDLKTAVVNLTDPETNKNKSQPYIEEMRFFDGEYLSMQDVWTNFHYEFAKLLVFSAQPGFLTAVRELDLEVASSHETDAEITKQGVNKKSALEWLGKKLTIPVAKIMAIGDGANDISMIEYAGIGVALKNSIPAVKQKADLYIDLTNEQGAVGYVIENYILNKGERNES